MIKFFYHIVILASPLLLSGQLPSTNLVLFDLKSNEKVVVLENPKYITSFNPAGYNNQPHFISNDLLWITSDYKSPGNTDIYQLDLINSAIKRLTATQESEFSPAASPNGHLTVVRQKISEDGDPDQKLWSYDNDRKLNEGPVTSEFDNIGYFCWLSELDLALYQVTSPNELVMYNLSNNKRHHIAYNVGRALKKDKNGDMFYVHKVGGSWSLRKFDIKSFTSSYIAEMIEGQEDFAILPNGDIISSHGAKLMHLKMVPNAEWKEITDLSSYRINKISRIAANNSRLAIVFE
jgi:hypothetical protein